MGYNVPHYIGGQLIHETDTEAQAIYNPALGEIIGQFILRQRQPVIELWLLPKRQEMNGRKPLL